MLYISRQILAELCEDYLIATKSLVDSEGRKVLIPIHEKVENAILGLLKITTGAHVLPDDTRDISLADICGTTPR